MSRTFISQIIQIYASDTFDDTVSPNLANFETNPVTIETDLNNLRSAVKSLQGNTNWYDVATRDVETLNTDLDALETQKLICGVDVLTNLTVAAGVAATQILTLTANPSDTETVTLSSKTYTFQTTLTDVDGNVLIGASASDSLDNLIAAITLGAGAGTDYATSTTSHPDSTAAAGAGDTMDASASKQGTFGNTIATTETLTNGSWGAATMSGGAGDVIVLSVSGSEAPTNSAGVSGGLGTVVAVLSGDVGAAELTEEVGGNALVPKNLVVIRDATTKDAIASNGQEIFGLLQAESGVAQGETFTDTTKQVQLTFVVNGGSDDLVTCDGADIGGKVIEYRYGNRIDLQTLPDDCNWPPRFSDQTASVDVTRSNAYTNQGGAAFSIGTTAILELAAGINWRISDANSATLFNIFEDSGGGGTLLQLGSDLDEFRSNAVLNNFNQGASFDTSATRTIDIGINEGIIETTSGDLQILAASELFFDDVNQTGSTWAQTAGIKLSETTAEWDLFEVNFGEASLLNAISQAAAAAGRTRVQTTVTSSVTANNDVNGPIGANNLDTNLPAYNNVTFVTDCDYFLNGNLLRNNATSGAEDVYPGTTPADGDIRFTFNLKGTGGNPDQITAVISGQ